MAKRRRKKRDILKTWRRYPVVVLNDLDEINNNIVIDSPGFVIRDYRFQPELIRVDPNEYMYGSGLLIYPGEINRFFAMREHNEQKIRKRVNKRVRKRAKRQRKKGITSPGDIPRNLDIRDPYNRAKFISMLDAVVSDPSDQLNDSRIVLIDEARSTIPTATYNVSSDGLLFQFIFGIDDIIAAYYSNRDNVQDLHQRIYMIDQLIKNNYLR